MNRRLYRCREDRILAGVASGVAEHFGLDPSLVRLLWLASAVFWGVTIFLYIAMIFIVPLEPLSPEAAAAHAASGAGGSDPGHRHRGSSGQVVTFIGVVLLVIGGVALIDTIAPGWATWRQLWPLVLIGVGGYLLATSLRRREPEPAAPNLPGGEPPAAPPVASTGPAAPVGGES